MPPHIKYCWWFPKSLCIYKVYKINLLFIFKILTLKREMVLKSPDLDIEMLVLNICLSLWVEKTVDTLTLWVY